MGRREGGRESMERGGSVLLTCFYRSWKEGKEQRNVKKDKRDEKGIKTEEKEEKGEDCSKQERGKRERTCESDDGEANAIDGDAAPFIGVRQDRACVRDGQLHACVVVVIRDGSECK
jgi:hypothetical protein